VNSAVRLRGDEEDGFTHPGEAMSCRQSRLAKMKTGLIFDNLVGFLLYS
jgi:hypothetical protein